MTGLDDDTLVGAVLRGGDIHADVPMVFASRERPHRTTVGELVAAARDLAAALQARGCGPGDVVAVQLPNWHEGAVAQLAVTLCGAVLLPVVQVYGPHELGFVLRQSGARMVVAASSWRGREPAAALVGLPDLPRLREVVVVGAPVPAGATAFHELEKGSLPTYGRPDVAPTERALLVYTSGTTSDPKGVQHSHASLLAELHSPRAGGGAGRKLALFPSGHVAGLLGLLRIVVLGHETVVLDTWSAADAAALVDEYGITSGVGAPVHLAGLLDERDRGAATLASLRAFLVGAAGVPPALVERAERAGIAAYRSYGSSEHPTISEGTPADPLVKRATTDGRVIGGNEVRIVDDTGADVPEGEIVTRGAELFLGYSDPALDHDAFLPGGWFRTGDIGRMDADGYLTITDRKKDVIIRGGENISSKEVEDVLSRHPRIAAVAAVGIPDERYGERVCAVVVLRDAGTGLDLAEIVRHFDHVGIARQKAPERLVVVDELPRTAAGKVQKFRVRELARAAGEVAGDR